MTFYFDAQTRKASEGHQDTAEKTPARQEGHGVPSSKTDGDAPHSRRLRKQPSLEDKADLTSLQDMQQSFIFQKRMMRQRGNATGFRPMM